ncbi:LysR family transcriptional regulator [Marinomonas sp. SBI22]|jgi:DNA-binding transcriptional LysR family regulator|uniref:LysR family transcriptional regulator n=1 Tax=unclassified Marinomonas TaxID=196814 RepID=UPI0007AF088D|nr:MULTISPECIES: LysR family transcriptional regulator [unclassified Marinomonas]KZM41621.1 LysR family transcriptional regulator [Marinomonas sp. SBI22]KZM43457.1 LysR family transcriptional regulator [Marinomonas sp. SBI8L]
MTYNAQLLDGMVIFVEVVNSGSFTQAAQNSGHSTSYISKEIHKLESRLGLRLMHRTTRSLSLTPEGEAYYRQCSLIINQAEEAESALSGQQLEPKGDLRISCPTSFGLSQMPEIFADFLDRYPLVNLDVDLNNRKVDMITEGYDILVRGAHQLDDSSLISRKIYSSHAVTIASPDYLKKYGTPAHPSELVNHQTISYSYVKQPNLWSFETDKEKPIQVQVKSRLMTNNSELELDLCLAGKGITRMPKFNLGDEIETGKLVQLFEDYDRFKIDVYLIYPSRKHLSSKVRCFIDFVSEALNKDR